MFKAKPALIISGIVSFPEPKTIALGGVATGNMNAQLAANTTGIVRATGAMPKATATAPTTGKNVEVVATLEVISVRKMIKVATAKINTIGGTFSNTVNPCPIQLPNPDDPIEAAKDKPPPNKTNKPQGNLFACSQVSKSVLLFSEGIKKKLSAAKIAIPASVKPDKGTKLSNSVLNIQAPQQIQRLPELFFHLFQEGQGPSTYFLAEAWFPCWQQN